MLDLTKMENDKYIHVKDWFISELHLKGNELLVYAIVYSFSEDGQGYFTGSLNWIAERLKTSKTMVCNIFAKLVEKGLLIKTTRPLDNGGFGCAYQINLLVESSDTTEKESSYQNSNGRVTKIVTPCYQNSNGRVTKMVTNNKYNNKDIPNNNIKDTESASENKTQKTVTDTYCEVYQKVYGQKFVPVSKDYWARASRLIRSQLKRFTVEQLCSAITMAKNDKWVVSKGFDLSIILSTNMIERFLNPNFSTSAGQNKRSDSYDWDKIPEEEIK